MKKIVYISLLLLIPPGLYAQQFPFMEAYNVNPFSMTPSYAGLKSIRTLFLDYRSDWTGVDGGPVTCQLSYNDRLKGRVGLGGRFIYDKTDIFRQTMLLGTYTYEVKIREEHFINFGLSAGFYKNSIDLGEYFNDPDFVLDAALNNGTEKSKVKVATDVSALYRYGNIEGGILFSNVMFGTAKYSDTDVTYKPLKNFLVHASYEYLINKSWAVKPFVLFRGGQHYPSQLELASEVSFKKKFWGMLVFRTGGIWGMGFGCEIFDRILLNYSYNLSTNVALNTFGSHQVTLGIRLFRPNPANQNPEMKPIEGAKPVKK
jgi:type IX secretion system PorP/SprF family membrane protein